MQALHRQEGLSQGEIAAQLRRQQFFPDRELEEVDADVNSAVSDSVADYLGYVLLDLATADPDLAEEALAAGFSCADESGFGGSFAKLARKELRLTVTHIADLRRRWPRIQEELAKTEPGQS